MTIFPIPSRFFKDFDKLFVGVASLQFIESSLFPYNPRQLMWPCPPDPEVVEGPEVLLSEWAC